jgi:hypothetical protein
LKDYCSFREIIILLSILYRFIFAFRNFIVAFLNIKINKNRLQFSKTNSNLIKTNLQMISTKKLFFLFFIFSIVFFKSQINEAQYKAYYKIALEYDTQPKEAAIKIKKLLQSCESEDNYVLAAIIYNKRVIGK